MLDVLSYAGMIMLILALMFNRKKRLYLLSDILNLIGSLSLTIWAVIFSAWAIFILDLVWSIISTITLVKDLRVKFIKKKKKVIV